jgi:molybdopterin converting factor small subunit
VQVTISFLGTLRDQVGSSAIVVEFPGVATYRDLLDNIAPTMRASLPAWAWDDEKESFARQMLVTRNLSADLREETTCLADGDQILVVSPLAGG